MEKYVPVLVRAVLSSDLPAVRAFLHCSARRKQQASIKHGTPVLDLPVTGLATSDFFIWRCDCAARNGQSHGDMTHRQWPPGMCTHRDDP
eukprot:347241-Chlamydomonas_euryale.AAC.11